MSAKKSVYGSRAYKRNPVSVRAAVRRLSARSVLAESAIPYSYPPRLAMSHRTASAPTLSTVARSLVASTTVCRSERSAWGPLRTQRDEAASDTARADRPACIGKLAQGSDSSAGLFGRAAARHRAVNP